MTQKRFWCPRDCGVPPQQAGRGWTAASSVSTWPTSLARRCCCISSSRRWPTATGLSFYGDGTLAFLLQDDACQPWSRPAKNCWPTI